MPKALPFNQATVPSHRAITGKSINGKSLAAIKESVQKDWDSIVFVREGKPVEYGVILTTDEGTMELEFFPDDAPNHVRSFVLLAKHGYYEGLNFHRCIPGFVIQGGCPLGNGTGGPGYNLKQEFNPRPHLKGVLSMARTNDPDTAGSQFFVCADKASFLDNQYTVFGKVAKGTEVIDKIVNRPGDRDSGAPKVPVVIRKVEVKTV